jgi:hypothetical protein
MRRSRRLAIVATLPMAVLAIGGESLSALQVNQPPSDEIPADWIPIMDDTRQISIAVPPAWTDIDTVPDGSGQPWISATTDSFLFFPPEGTAETYSVPGTLYRAFPVVSDPAEWLETSLYHDRCVSDPIQDFRNDVFVGYVQQFSQCGGTASTITQVAATRVDNAFTVFLHVQLVGEPDDPETLNFLLQSMN